MGALHAACEGWYRNVCALYNQTQSNCWTHCTLRLPVRVACGWAGITTREEPAVSYRWTGRVWEITDHVRGMYTICLKWMKAKPGVLHINSTQNQNLPLALIWMQELLMLPSTISHVLGPFQVSYGKQHPWSWNTSHEFSDPKSSVATYLTDTTHITICKGYKASIYHHN